ncbi:MAG: hypothetical protein D6712_08775 [Chloroflexi bacterium]|nr:MAG: hypothetical protein D6712_08775 [Chloroflexota bacterium]
MNDKSFKPETPTDVVVEAYAMASEILKEEYHGFEQTDFIYEYPQAGVIYTYPYDVAPLKLSQCAIFYGGRVVSFRGYFHFSGMKYVDEADYLASVLREAKLYSEVWRGGVTALYVHLTPLRGARIRDAWNAKTEEEYNNRLAERAEMVADHVMKHFGDYAQEGRDVILNVLSKYGIHVKDGNVVFRDGTVRG